MADLEPRLHQFMPMPPPFMRQGRNADEPIMIGSSDDEGEDAGRPTGPGRATIEEQRARLHHNRTGTPIPRALENGLRIMSPPPPLPVHHPGWNRRPEWPHPALHPGLPPQSIHQRLANLGAMRSPDAWRRILGHEHVGRILGLMFPDFADRPQRQQEQEERVEYDVRMTHSRAKPRLGYTFDFAPDEEEEEGGAETTKTGPVRTRTTIVIPDSPPVEPVDRKGKGRAKTPAEVAEVLDLESGEWAESVSGPSTSTSSPKSRKRRAVETIEILSDDDNDGQSGDELIPEQGTVLVCASCRRPLRMGGGRLWALRCGHVIDSRCYRRLGERPVVQEEAPIPAPAAPDPEPATLKTTKRRRVSGGGGRKGKGKSKARPEPVAVATAVAPYQAETLEWNCPVHRCGRAHWSERMVTAGKSAWQPMKETGAIGVFV